MHTCMVHIDTCMYRAGAPRKLVSCRAFTLIDSWEEP